MPGSAVPPLRRGLDRLPLDIGQRFRGQLPADLDEGQRRLHDEILSGSRGAGPVLFPLTDAEGRLAGPFGPMLLSPGLGDALQALGAGLRYRSVLPHRLRELVVLTVAHHWGSSFEAYAHEAVGRHVGLTEVELAALRRGEAPVLDDDDETVAVATARVLLERGDLDDSEYARAIRQLGERALFELLTLIGYYGALALQLRVYRIGAPWLPRARGDDHGRAAPPGSRVRDVSHA